MPVNDKERFVYDWVPYEVRCDHAESVIGYVVIGLVVLAIALGVLFVGLDGLS